MSPGPETPRRAADIDQTLVQSEAQRLKAMRLGGEVADLPQVPGYRVVRKLGQGAFGQVFLGIDDNSGRAVAIKIFSSDRGLDWPLLRREVGQLVQVVTERRVVQLLKVGSDAERPYYVMEYLEGGSLADRLEASAPDVEEAAELLLQIAEALVYLHGKAILHCDLKPANILLDSAGQVRLADFGQSRAAGEHGPAAGTFFYMPPEQATPEGRPDVRSDLYALGAVAYTMLTGRPPYATEEASRDLASSGSVTERIQRYREIIGSSPAPSGHRQVPGIDRALVEILDRCMARDPERRFENAQQVVDALEARKQWRSQRPLLVAGLLGPLVLLLAVGAIGYFAFSEAESGARAALTEQSLEANLDTARVTAAAVDRNLSAVKRRVGREAERHELRQLLSRPDTETGALRERAQGLADELYDAYRDRHFYSWVIADAAATAHARAPYDSRVIGHSYAYREWFSGQVEQQQGDLPELAGPRRDPGLTLAFRSTAAGEPILISVAAPIAGESADGDPAGVLAATLHLETFNEWLGSAESQPTADGCPDRFVVLLNRGQLVRHPCPAAGMASPPVAAEGYFESASLRDLLARQPPTHPAFVDPLRPGGTYLAAASRLEQNPDWIAIVLQDRSAAMSPVSRLASRLKDLARTAAGVGLLVIAILWLLLWRVTRAPAGFPSSMEVILGARPRRRGLESSRGRRGSLPG